MGSACIKVTKYFLFLFNLLFFVLGAVILGFGVWILADRSSFISVLPEAGDGRHRDQAHSELHGWSRGQPSGGLGLRAGSGEVLRLGQLLQLDRKRRAHESHQHHLPLFLQEQERGQQQHFAADGLLRGPRWQWDPEQQQPRRVACVQGGLHGEGAGLAAGEPGHHPWRVCGRRCHRASGDAPLHILVPAHPFRRLQQGPQVLKWPLSPPPCLSPNLRAPRGLPGSPSRPASHLTAKTPCPSCAGWKWGASWGLDPSPLLFCRQP
nr:CD82 antigen isoform X2 [Globicephala melas]